MMSASADMFLVAAGVLAGIVGTAGGITSLVSYPALLVVGIPPLAANVVNIVALTVCWPGSAMASRPELAGRAGWLGRWIWLPAAGGAAGSVLLVSTPASAFDRIVPYLVACGALALLLQPKLSATAGARFGSNKHVLRAGLLSVMVYNGYFGAGAGVMTLALVLFAIDPHLPRANAIKNMLIGAATVTAASVLVLVGPVAWSAIVPLAIGMFVGSTLGPRLARRLPALLLRWLVALLGLGLAVQLWFSAR
jgi:uncharacterized membrane protein YfcA